MLQDLAKHLSEGTPLRGTTEEQLLQGPFADAMTHAGQLAMLRRLARSPVPPENFIVAQIDPANLGPAQAPPASPDAVWPESPDPRPNESGLVPRAVPVRRLEHVDERHIEGLVDVLADCVEYGASVSFMHPLTRERAAEFWRGIARAVAAGERVLLVAEDEYGICGTVQLIFALPENQPHRADLAKMLVHRRARQRGVGAALVRAAEQTARECGKTVLVLDTVTGSTADRLYTRLGWQRVGEIPQYALLPQGGLVATTVFYRLLD
jgi:GNAT superfamily N-acetyltransferase